jgi:hypothetical protein
VQPRIQENGIQELEGLLLQLQDGQNVLLLRGEMTGPCFLLCCMKTKCWSFFMYAICEIKRGRE